MKYLLFYEPVEGILARSQPYMEPHREHIRRFHEQGKLLMIGGMEDVERNGAVAVFTTRESAEAFAKADPFIVNGTVGRWHVIEWHEILAP
ncbi:YciI-like protein [Caballeronia sordidicola]|uniref:YciI-like protein n=1 Tax=Caballeronia sordidicola TaxID=196367 RepID=A0A158EQE7_CABSO|nr:YciI family protein [Caballeronia sordidicola]SAL09703.1 YciI-like protein [Caballeronia sordidicola]